ncbi:hypothetical protein N0V82_008526 [Gnomoniopsis sp. IMI 355080]|nr:hypothetical protein N0V82_008526 [Gnomoniopsis sp. IMI 355080]
MSPSIRIATYGGGLAGAILVHGLLNYQQLDYQAFTADASFNEAPAAAITGLATNALNALELLGPQTSRCFQRAQATSMKGVRFMLGQGKEGRFIAEEKSPDDGTPTLSMVYNAPFVDELLACVPPERMHPSKKLEKIERKHDNGLIVLHFTDGTTHECDILVAADGMDSFVRPYILGVDDHAASPRNTGAWAIIAQKNSAKAKEILGDDLLKENYECAWIGDGVFLEPSLFNLNGTELLNIIVASYDKEGEYSDRRRRVVHADELKELFKSWPDRPKMAVSELLCDRPEQPAMYLWEHPPTRTYVSGSMCVLGDAAHEAVPWQGPSNGMMVEDVVILSTVLGRATSPAEAVVALEVYDEIRRPRTQRSVDSSRENGIIMTGRGKDTGMDLDKLQEKLLPRWYFIVDFDVEEHRAEAIQRLDSKLNKD